jgi:hypothetical protein
MKKIDKDGDIYYLTGPTKLVSKKTGFAVLVQLYEFSGHPELLDGDGSTYHKGRVELTPWGEHLKCDVPGEAQVAWFKTGEGKLVPINYNDYLELAAQKMWDGILEKHGLKG